MTTVLALKPKAVPVGSQHYRGVAGLATAGNAALRAELGLPVQSPAEARATLVKDALDLFKDIRVDVFDRQKVITFLGKLARRKTGLLAVAFSKPDLWVKEGENANRTYFKGQWYARWTKLEIWSGSIPISILTKIKMVKDEAKKRNLNVGFQVGEVVEGDVQWPARDPDPFIQATFSRSDSGATTSVVFGVWDEPEWTE